MAASGEVMLSAAQQAALKVELPTAGDSDTVMIAAGMSATRAGVTFTCDSDYDCTVTVTNSLGTIVAMWASQTLGDGTASSMASGHEAAPDPLAVPAVLNAASPSSVSMILGNPIEDTTNAPPASPHGNASTTVGGLGLDEEGAHDLSMLSLTSDLDPNTTTAHTPRVIDLSNGSTTTAAAGGSTMTYADDMITEDVNEDTVARGGWAHNKVLFRDWGDTAGMGDGGFETGALVYSNMEEPTMAAFDRMLADMFANQYVRGWFTLNTAGAVVIDTDGTANGWATPVQTIMINVEGSQAAAVQINIPAVDAANIATANEYRGTYFDAPGKFACVGTGFCLIERGDTGETDFMVADTDSADGFQPGTQADWHFTPDPGAMVYVPDQDWIVFGAWLTTPDDTANGQHRLGVFHDGMQTYAYAQATAPMGSAKYNGSATGVYKSGPDMAAGLFTARVMLTADYDAAGTDNHRLSGRIDDFKDTAGRYLGADTAADPNDPVAGGENDWVVILNPTEIVDGGGVTGGTVGGSADGVSWSTVADDGGWSAQLYGPVLDGTTRIPASAVAGQFRAESGMDMTHRAVVGAFGAEEMMSE